MSRKKKYLLDELGSERAVSRRSIMKAGFGLLATTIIGTALRVDAQEEESAMLESLLTFNRQESDLLAAIADRIWPPDDDTPGAAELGAHFYIDHALAGPYSTYREVYHRVLRQIEEMAARAHGFPFAQLGSSQQDAILIELENLNEDEDLVARLEGPEYEMGPPTSFEMIRSHVMEGVFADPIYGGNREFGGWRSVNYPGAHYIYTAEEQQTFEPLNKPYLSVADL